jgi:hypothetical protein
MEGTEMKKFLIVACAVALVFGSLGVVAMAGNNERAAFCKAEAYPGGPAVWEYYGYKNLGDCVSAMVRNDFWPKYCKRYVDFAGMETWEYLGFKNRGDCVSYYRDLFKN